MNAIIKLSGVSKEFLSSLVDAADATPAEILEVKPEDGKRSYLVTLQLKMQKGDEHPIRAESLVDLFRSAEEGILLNTYKNEELERFYEKLLPLFSLVGKPSPCRFEEESCGQTIVGRGETITLEMVVLRMLPNISTLDLDDYDKSSISYIDELTSSLLAAKPIALSLGLMPHL